LQENGVLDPKTYWDKLKATDPLVEFRTEPKMQMVITPAAARYVEPVRPRIRTWSRRRTGQGNQDRHPKEG
jgi:hypothetical protein